MKKFIEEYQDILLEVVATGLFFAFVFILLNAIYELSSLNLDFLL